MLIFNGKAMIAAGLGIAAGVALILANQNRMLAIICAILTAMIVDVWMRFHSEDCERPLIDPAAGAHVWFAPMWLVGIILGVLIGLSEFRII
jgi:hypothetical protein